MGRPKKYTPEEIGAVLRAYEDTEHGTRKDLADSLGVSYRSLITMVCNWRKQGYQASNWKLVLPEPGTGGDSTPYGR